MVVAQPDGLYGVSTPYFSASYEVENGNVTRCAPILRRRLSYWQTIARYLGPVPERKVP